MVVVVVVVVVVVAMVVAVVVVSSEACHAPPEVIWAVAVVVAVEWRPVRWGGVVTVSLSCPASPVTVTQSSLHHL